MGFDLEFLLQVFERWIEMKKFSPGKSKMDIRPTRGIFRKKKPELTEDVHLKT